MGNRFNQQQDEKTIIYCVDPACIIFINLASDARSEKQVCLKENKNYLNIISSLADLLTCAPLRAVIPYDINISFVF